MMSFNTIRKQTQDIISFGIGARLLNFLKGILIAFYIGASYRTDVYLVAFSASVFLIGIVAEALIVSLIPIYQQIEKRDGKKGRFEFTDNLISFWTLAGLFLILIGYLAAPLILRAFGPGFGSEGSREAVRLFRLGLPIILMHVWRAIFAGYLQAQHKFRAGAKGGVANSLIYILYLIFLSRRFGLEGLMVAGILAVGVQAFLLAQPVLKLQGYRYRPRLLLKERNLVRLNMFIIPIMLGVGINNLNQAVDNAIGSFLQAGTIAELNYADGIVDLFVGAILMALVTAIFPVISERMRLGDSEETMHSISYSLRLVTMVSIPSTVLLIFLAQPIVRLFYERGEFGAEATAATATMLIWYGVGIFGMGLLLLITRIYYAREDTITPVAISAVALVLNIILDIGFVQLIGPGGLALGTSLASTIAAFYGICRLNRLYGFLTWAEVGMKGLKLFMAGIVMSSILVLLTGSFGDIAQGSFIGTLVLVVVSGAIGIGSFLSIVFVTRA